MLASRPTALPVRRLGLAGGEAPVEPPSSRVRLGGSLALPFACVSAEASTFR